MERQNKSRLLVCLSCVLITLSVLLLPLAFFETNIFVKRSANTFVGDEKYVEARAEVEAVAAQYEGASIEESVTERVNSKGVATSMVTFTVKEKIKRNGLDFLLPGFRKYLKEKYKTDQALSAAWGVPLKLDTVPAITEADLHRRDRRAQDSGEYLIAAMREMSTWFYRTLAGGGYPGLSYHWDMILRTLEFLSLIHISEPTRP